MLRYSAEAVLESRKQMDSRGLIHKPMIGRIFLGLFRTSMRLVNHVPSLKRRMAESETRLRKNPAREKRLVRS